MSCCKPPHSVDMSLIQISFALTASSSTPLKQILCNKKFPQVYSSSEILESTALSVRSDREGTKLRRDQMFRGPASSVPQFLRTG